MSCSSCQAKAGLCRRPVDKDVMAKMSFPKVKNVWTVDNKLGGWEKLQQRFFDDKVGASCRLTAVLRFSARLHLLQALNRRPALLICHGLQNRHRVVIAWKTNGD